MRCNSFALPCLFFFLNQWSLLVDCFFLKKPTFPSKTTTSPECWALKSSVTLSCSLLRGFSLLRFSQVLYENICAVWHLVNLHRWNNLSLIKVALLSKGTWLLSAPSQPVSGPAEKWLLYWWEPRMPVSQGVMSLINSWALTSGSLGISSRLLFQTLISYFNFLSLRIGSKSLTLVCSVLNLHSDKKIKKALSENLSISIIRNIPHKGFGWRSCISGRFYTSLYLSLPKNRCHYMAHTDPRGTHCSCFKLISSIQFYKWAKGMLRINQECRDEKLCLCFSGSHRQRSKINI